jgi:hypothetical protein
MDYSEGYRTQRPLLRVIPGTVEANEWRRIQHSPGQSQGRTAQVAAFSRSGEEAAFEACRAELSLQDKLRILSGQDCGAGVDFVRHRQTQDSDPNHEFESDSAGRKFRQMVLWHCERLYYLMLGQWIGDRVDSLKQKCTGVADRRRCAATR